jgi:hypothetical protein
MSTIVNRRTIAELARLEARGVPVNEAILQTHSVQYANKSIVQSGGRIVSARVSGGSEMPAHMRLSAAEIAEGGLQPTSTVRFGFDIDLDVVPAGTPPAPGPGPAGGGGVAVPVVPVPAGDREGN